MTARLLETKQKYKSYPSKRILLIEDNDMNRMLLSDYLGYFNYDVIGLPEASQFFSTVEQFQPELILLDLKLPDIDGYSILTQIKQKPKYSKIPVIVVSAFAFKADQDKAMKLGACRYFVKPVNLNELVAAIEEELARHSN
ncbi:two-component system response regulator [Calothrix sp. HK-06]|nr:two-component system response regulator [Calothrix sp. HK-06]